MIPGKTFVENGSEDKVTSKYYQIYIFVYTLNIWLSSGYCCKIFLICRIKLGRSNLLMSKSKDKKLIGFHIPLFLYFFSQITTVNTHNNVESVIYNNVKQYKHGNQQFHTLQIRESIVWVLPKSCLKNTRVQLQPGSSLKIF